MARRALGALGRFGGIVGQVGRASLGHERETESDLLFRVRAGDKDAFSELVERNEGPALAVAQGFVDAVTAQDVVSDAVERLWVLLKSGEGPTYCLRPYFLQMVRNRAVDYQRRAKEVPVESIEPGAVDFENEVDADNVRTAFEALPERWQAALWLGVVERRSHSEIGRELDVAEGAASQLLHRAREGLRQSYLNVNVGDGSACPELDGMVGRYLRGRASRRDVHRVHAHLDKCETCRAAVTHTKQLSDRMGAVLAITAVGGIGLALVQRPGVALAAGLGGGPTRAWAAAKASTTPGRVLIGAVAGLALVAGLFIALPGNRGDDPADAIRQQATPSGAVPESPSAISPTPGQVTLVPPQPSECGSCHTSVPVKPKPSAKPISKPTSASPPVVPPPTPTEEAAQNAGPG